MRAVLKNHPYQEVSAIKPMVLSIKFIFKSEVEGHCPQENSFRPQFGNRARALKHCARFYRIDPNVANLLRGKTHQSVPDVATSRLGVDEAYFYVRDILSEVSTVADGALSRERSGFYRCGFATLGSN